jgi:hypothetical protein
LTTPSGPDGFDTTDRWPLTGNDGSISGLANRTQGAVTNALKGQVRQSGGWGSATASVWGGLRRGSDGNPVSLPLAIIEFFGRTLLGAGTWNALNQLNTDVSAFFSGKWTSLTNIVGDIGTLINEIGGTIITDVSDAIKAAQAKADEAADKFADMLDGVLGTGHGIADFVDWLQARRDETQATWDAFWQGIFGGSATGKNFLDLKSAAEALTSIANTAKANSDSAMLQLAALIDTVLGGGHAISDLANYIINTWNGLVSGWNNLWDGVFGTSGATGKTAGDVKIAVASVSSTANNASTNAGLAQTKANTASSWLTRLLTDLTILFDWLHITYPVGTSSDTSTTTSGGKRTWYSAWADLMDLVGLSQNTSPPTDPASAIGDRIVQTEINQKNAQNFQISALTSTSRNPAWMCRYPVGDVAYPEIQNGRLSTYDSAGQPAPSAAAGTYVGSDVPWKAYPGFWVIPAGATRGTFITISNTAVMDTIGTVVNKQTGTVDNLFLELFRINPDYSMTRLNSFEISGEFTTAAATKYVEREVPNGFIAQAGEAYIVRTRNASTGTASISVQGVELGPQSVQTGHYTADGNTAKTSYTISETAASIAATRISPWALIASKGQTATDQLYADDFNRSGMGGLWYLQSTSSDQMGIVLGTASYMGTAAGHQHGLYTRPLASDRMWVEGNLYNINSSVQEGLLLNSNRDLSQIVYLAVNNVEARIYTGSAGSLTSRASVSTLFNSVPWQFYYDPPTKKYTVLKDGKSIGLSWTDSGNLMQHGALFRYGGLRISRSGLLNGGSIDNWLLQDWS